MEIMKGERNIYHPYIILREGPDSLLLGIPPSRKIFLLFVYRIVPFAFLLAAALLLLNDSRLTADVPGAKLIVQLFSVTLFVTGLILFAKSYILQTEITPKGVRTVRNTVFDPARETALEREECKALEYGIRGGWRGGLFIHARRKDGSRLVILSIPPSFMDETVIPLLCNNLNRYLGVEVKREGDDRT